MSEQTKKPLPYLLLLVAVIIFFRKVLLLPGYVIPWDFRYFHYPLATFIADALRSGHTPLWDPYTYCGRPFFADPQAQLFYPPTILTILFSNLIGGDRLLYLLEWQLALHVFFAGACTYLLLTRLGLTRAAALCGALTFELGAFFASQTQHLGAIDAGAWLPLAAFSVLIVAPKSIWRGVAGISFSIAMCFLAGFPAVTITVVGTVVLLSFATLRYCGSPRRVAATITGGFVLAALLSAVQLIPALELTSLSVAKYRTDWLTPGGLPLQSLVSLVYPNYYGIFDLHKYHGPWNLTFLYVYCGIAALALAIAAIVMRAHKLVPPIGVLAVLAAIWMLGTSTPAGVPLYYLTARYLQGSVYPHYGLLAFSFLMAVLAAFGASRLLPREWMRYSAALLIAIDLIATGSGRPFNTAALAEEPGITRHSIGESLSSLLNEQSPPYRFDTLHDAPNLSMAAPLLQLPSANGYNPMALERYIQVRLLVAKGNRWGAWYELENPDSPVADLLNIRCVIARGAVQPRAGVLPRFFVVSRTVKAGSLEEAANLARAPSFDFRNTAIVEGDVLPMMPGASRVEVLTYSPNEVVLSVHTDAAGFLVTSEVNYPGWKAEIDTRPVSILTTNLAFRGISLPGGTHQIRFHFASSTLFWGFAVSGVSCAILTLCLIRGRHSNPPD